MFDQETLRTFIKVAETRSFSKAAGMLHKTPAAISYRIKVLEESLGTQLFNRTTRTVSLTPGGQHLLDRCHQWLSWIDAMPGELAQINDGVERQVNVVVNNLLYHPQAIAGLLAWLHPLFPFTQFTFSRQVYMGVWDALLYQDCQLAIGVTGFESLRHAVNLLPLGEVSWQFVVAADHPLAQKEGELTNAQLRRWPAVNIEDTSQTLTRRIAWLLAGQREIKVPDLEAKLACHLSGVGVGFLPRRVCQPWVEQGKLVVKAVGQRRQPSPLSLAWYGGGKGRAVDEIVRLFQQRTVQALAFLNNIDRPAPAELSVPASRRVP